MAARGLQAAETKIEIATSQHATGKIKTRWIPALCAALDISSARIGQTQQLSHLIKRPTCRIIKRRTQDSVLADGLHRDQLSVTAADDQTNGWLRSAWIIKERRKQMCFQMIDPDKWLSQADRDSFGRRISNQ